MSVTGFIFMLGVTILGITVGAYFAEAWTAPGLQRTLTVGLVAAAFVFPAAKLAAWFGWIRGGFAIGGSQEAKPADNSAANPVIKQADGGRPS